MRKDYLTTIRTPNKYGINKIILAVVFLGGFLFCSNIHAQDADVLITNEMPFGHGLAASDEYDATAAGESISAHTLRGRCIEAAWYPTRAFISTDSFGR